jgi:hypothetical protein
MKKHFIALLAVALLLAALLVPTVAPVIVGAALCGAILWIVADMTRGFRRARLATAINTLPASIGTSVNSRRYKATAAMATKHVFVKQGATDELVAAMAAVSDKPLGVIDDEAPAANDPINVQLLSATNRTIRCIAGAAIAALNVDMYVTAAGKVVIKPTAAGTYWKVGRNLTLADADGDPIELEPCEPRKLIVIAALGNANGEIAAITSSATTTQAEFEALRDKCEELADDVRAIAAALDGSADVALATT